MLLLTVFGLLIAASTLLAVRLARDVSLVRQYDALMDDLKIIAGEVSEKLDDDDADPYAFLEVTARIQKNERHFSYILREQDGTILAPTFMLDREIHTDRLTVPHPQLWERPYVQELLNDITI